ncbi:2Fe-2S iron-sulfur cluster-binding protein [Streptomyces sp. NPDC048636]|uniref:2Fe-2S iron-sulfur cluster-binding protein n=1 Tax=Streptomyces sp. NPDC048636 TaxID=3155762 RepID=UPI0034487E7B
MSDEQRPHRPEPGSGWQPMPHGSDWDADSTAFVQLPPDYAFPDPSDPSGSWDPLAAPGTGYTPPPVTGGPDGHDGQGGQGAPSQGGQWQPPHGQPGHGPAAHGQGGHDPGATGQWTMPPATDGSGYGYGGQPDPFTPRASQWPAPAEDPHAPQTGHWPVRGAEPVDDWPVPASSDDGTGAPVHTSQWTIPVAGDEVDETGEYRVDDHPGPAAPPYGGAQGGPRDPQTTAEWRIPFADAGPGRQQGPQQPSQQGGTGQWSIPPDAEGAERSGEYAAEGRSAPAPRPAPARRPLRMPGTGDRAQSSGPGAAPEADPATDQSWHGSAGDSGEFPGAAAHTGLRTPPHGSPVPAAPDDPAWPAPGDSGAYPVDPEHGGRSTPPHGSPAPGLPRQPGRQGEFTGETHAGDSHGRDALGHAAPENEPGARAGDTADRTAPHPDAEAEGQERPAAEDEFTEAPAEAPAEAPETPGTAAPAEDPADAPEAADDPAEPLPADAPSDPGADAPERDGAAAATGGTGTDAEPPHSEHPQASYVLRVNGADRPVTDSWIGESLLYVLRERLGLAGAKDGCSQGECGACSVQVDGRLVASCLVPAATAAGSEVRTVEGLSVDGRPSDVQRALAECGAVQCGFCVPGLAMTVHDLLEGNHAPTDQETRQAICGNLCRCSGYRPVVDAVREVVAGREAAEEAAAGGTEDTEGGATQDGARIPHQAGPSGPPGIGGHGSANGTGSGSGRAS